MQSASFVIVVYTAVAMCFQLVGGYLGDRLPKRLILALFTCIQAGGVMVLVFASTLPMFYFFAVVFGMGFGGRNPLTVAIRGEYFGTVSFGKIMGLSTVPMNLLLLGAAPFAGWVYDVRGDYTIAFLVLAGLNLAGAVCFILSKRPAGSSPPRAAAAGDATG